MKILGYILAAIGGSIVGYLIGEERIKITFGSPKKTGMGSAGVPRYGKPKTRQERLATHEARYGTSKLPERGTELKNFPS